MVDSHVPVPPPSAIPSDPAPTVRWKKAKLIFKVIEVRLRFIAVLVVTGLLIGYWDTVKNYWDKWARPAVTSETGLQEDEEFYCAMDPQITRPGLDPDGRVPMCPICGMPLTKHKKHTGEALPPGVTARVQLSPERIELAGIQTVEVHEQPMTRDLAAVGSVTYDESRLSRVVSRVNGYVEKLSVDTTFVTVKKGDVLAEIYSPELYSSAQELLLAAKRGTASDLVEASKQRLRLLGVDEREIDAVLESGTASPRLVLRSPRAGHVIRKDIVAGSRVEAGMTLLEIADLSVVWVEADVYERDISVLSDRQPIDAVVEAYPNEVFEGHVSLVHPHVEAATRTILVRFEIENPNHKLRPGMYATVRIKTPLGNVLAVPEQAVVDTGARQVVYVEHKPGEFHGVEVSLGPRVDGMYVVEKGLQAGDRVAAAGAFLIDAETRLNPAAASAYFGAVGSTQAASSATQPSAAKQPAADAKSDKPRSTEKKPSASDLKNIAELPAEERPLALMQRLCPVRGEPLGSMGMPYKVVLNGQSVFLCCKGCVSKAKDHADEVLKTVNELKAERR